MEIEGNIRRQRQNKAIRWKKIRGRMRKSYENRGQYKKAKTEQSYQMEEDQRQMMLSVVKYRTKQSDGERSDMGTEKRAAIKRRVMREVIKCIFTRFEV